MIRVVPPPFRLIQALVLGAAAAVGASLAVMYTDREPPAVSRTVRVVQPVVRAGESLVLEYTVDRRRDCETTTERTLYDGAGEEFRLESMARLSAGPMGLVSYRRVIPVPASAATGRARYRVVVAYRCNPLHRVWPIKVVAADVKFSIAPPVAKAAALPP